MTADQYLQVQWHFQWPPPPPPPPQWQWNGLKRLMSRALLSRHDEGNFPKLSASACMRDKPCLFLRTNQLNSNTQIIMYSREADCRRHPWNNVAQNELRITYVNFSRLLTITENVVDFEGKLEEPALWIKKKDWADVEGKGSKEGGEGVWEQIKENSLLKPWRQEWIHYVSLQTEHCHGFTFSLYTN